MYTISGAYATLFAIFTNFHRCSRLAISLRRSRPLKMTSPRKVTTLMIRQLTQGMLWPSMLDCLRRRDAEAIAVMCHQHLGFITRDADHLRRLYPQYFYENEKSEDLNF